MSKERELLKRVRDTLHELKETHYDLYWDIQAELNQDEQDVVIKELAELLSDVLYVWRGYSKYEEYDLYVKATDYLKGLGYE
jgi:hypothetical protein